MIEKFVTRFDENRTKLREWFTEQGEHYRPNYTELVTAVVVQCLQNEDEYSSPDPARIKRIDFGSYQGTLVFVIGANGYQPSQHWACAIGYGSCSGCDTLQAVHDYEQERRIEALMTLSLHVIQRLVEIST